MKTSHGAPVAALTRIAALLALAASGCISVDIGGKKSEAAPEDRFHVLDAADLGAWGDAAAAGTRPRDPTADAPPESASAPQGRRPVLAVRTFRTRDRFAKHVVRRDDPGRITPLDHELWADEPSHSVTDAVREALATCGAFAAVVDPSDAHDAALVLDGTLLEFSVVLPAATSPGPASAPSGGVARALFRARLTVAEAKSGRVLSTGSYAGEADLPGATTSGLGPAMSRALGQALQALLADMDAARLPANE